MFRVKCDLYTDFNDRVRSANGKVVHAAIIKTTKTTGIGPMAYTLCGSITRSFSNLSKTQEITCMTCLKMLEVRSHKEEGELERFVIQEDKSGMFLSHAGALTTILEDARIYTTKAVIEKALEEPVYKNNKGDESISSSDFWSFGEHAIFVGYRQKPGFSVRRIKTMLLEGK